MSLGIKRAHKWLAHAGVDGQITVARITLLSRASNGLYDANGWRHNVFLYPDGRVTRRSVRSFLILRQFLREFFQRLIDDHLGYPANHALPHIGNQPAHLRVSLVG